LALFAALGAVWFGMLYLFFGLVITLVATALEAPAADLSSVMFGHSPQDAVLRAWFAGVIATVAYEWIALSRSERRLVERFRAEIVPKGERIDSKMALKDMAIASGMPVAPALYEIAGTNVNAFVAHAIGRRPVVGVTSGFLSKLDLDMQRAVFANLVARLRSGDTLVNTAISALMAPLESWRYRREARQNEALDGEFLDSDAPTTDPLAALLVFGIAMVLLGEIVAAGHRRAQLRIAEKADAEGMLLLKDPRAMLAALQRCVELDNVVPSAGEAYGQLFYCWTGDSTNDEDDPEWRRVARLREVLGVEGWVAADEPLAVASAAPLPPRLEGGC
jgi:Zn-dependent protease with chaperone function